MEIQDERYNFKDNNLTVGYWRIIMPEKFSLSLRTLLQEESFYGITISLKLG